MNIFEILKKGIFFLTLASSLFVCHSVIASSGSTSGVGGVILPGSFTFLNDNSNCSGNIVFFSISDKIYIPKDTFISVDTNVIHIHLDGKIIAVPTLFSDEGGVYFIRQKSSIDNEENPQ